MKNPREYSWSVDTLRFGFQLVIQDVFGISPNDVYAVGECDFDGGVLWHFDGSNWSPILIDPNLGYRNLYGVYAPEGKTVFAVGERVVPNPNPPPNFLDSSLALLFDAGQWFIRKLPGKGLSAVWGISDNNVWTVGREGTAFFYDGTRWEKREIRQDVSFTAISGGSATDVYAMGYTLDSQPYDSIMHYVFHFDGAKWTLTDSLIENTHPPNHAFGIGDISVLTTTVYSAGYGIFLKGGAGWQKVFEDGSLFGAIRGNTQKNVYAVGRSIYHFNGEDWFQFAQFQDQSKPYLSVWTNETEVFAVRTDGTLSYVYHGR
ncbi:MAG: hypothetical protein HYY49_05805 [Ignavibacteriales bacterium]|nr:hypothetical protein [Ignavibacteriales bacterium]